MGAAVAPPAGFHSTMQLLKRQLNKIIVLIEFVIYGGLQTPWVYRSSYALMVRFYVCLCTHTLVFLTALRLRERHLFFLPPQRALGGFNRQHSKLHPGK